MEKRQRVWGLVMAPLEALTGAVKNVLVPVPQPPLPEAAAGIAAMRGAGTEIVSEIETESAIGSEIETESGIGNGIEIETETNKTETGTEIESGTGTGIETGSGTESERALSADQIHSLNAEPLERGILCMCMEKT